MTTTTTNATATMEPIVKTGVPALQISVRSKNVVNTQSSEKYGVIDVTLPVCADTASAGDCRHVEYSQDGSLIAYVHTQFIMVHKAATGAFHVRIERPNVTFISFSPQNSFIVTWERSSEANADNLTVWDLATGASTYRTSQKYCNAENWPLIKWTDDEMIAGRLVTNEIHFFNGRNIGILAKKCKLADIVNFEFAPGDAPYKYATFVPEKKANEAKMIWNKKGTSLLIHTSTDMDKTGKSYYGETGLWFLSMDNTSFSLGIKGPIHDVKWSPSIDQFIVCYGNPFMTTLFNIKGNPMVDFGSLPRNTIRFSPNGKLLALGGFGNLQGDMDFWDMTRYRKIASTHAHCAIYSEWAADSVHFLTAVLSPRIRVDNGIRVMRYDGTIVHNQSIPELYQAFWRPMNPVIFPDEKIVTPSPTLLKETASPPQKYTPPSQRAAAAPAPVAAPVGLASLLPPGFKIHIAPGGSGAPGDRTTTTTSSTTPAGPPRELTPEEAREKKIKTLERKLKEIEQLKSKLEQGEFLPPTAIEKIHNEARFRDELNRYIAESK
eukprot:gene425-504_t